MSTTDEIMALAGAFADAEDADFALHTLDELRAAVAALVAERDLAIHEQDTAQESLRRHQMWLQEAQAERDALRQDAERFRAIRQCRKTVQLYVYEAADDPFSGGWSYKNDPEDFDKFADAAMKEQK